MIIEKVEEYCCLDANFPSASFLVSLELCKDAICERYEIQLEQLYS